MTSNQISSPQDVPRTDAPAKRSDPYKTSQRYRWTSIKSRLRSQLRKSPQIEAPVIRLWRKGRFLFVRSKWKLEASIGSRRGTHVRNIDVDKIYCVSPQKIVFSSLQEFRFCDHKGLILGGDWDQLDKRFDTLDLYLAIKQVCLEGNRWAATVFYQRMLEDMQAGQFHYGCHNEKDLQARCQDIESLFHKIQREGYKSQQELFRAGSIQDPLLTDYEVSVSIGRNGDLLFSSGAHRLAIAKLLEIPTIPIKVTVRHTDWIKFRDELSFYARDDPVTKSKQLYQPITHPDLASLPAAHKCEDRFKLIEDNLPIRQGRLLDIGASLGYFCHRFEEKGFDCCAVENHPPTVYFLKRLARAENRRFRIITESVLDSQEIRSTHFDIVLALNIFHHFLKTKEDFDKLVDLLQNLQMDELFFEPHLPAESQMESAYRNYSPDEFVRFILDNSSLHKADLLGKMKDGRSLYKLY